MAKRDNWTREQSTIALYYYCKIPFGKVTDKHPDVIKVSNLIGRSIGSIKMKIGNFGSLDPELKKKGIVGLANTSKLDEDVWDYYSNNWDKLAEDAELLIAEIKGVELEKSVDIDLSHLPEGRERLALIKARINQTFFRNAILASYDNRCAITGLPVKELLIASHIKPWVDDEKNRLNPSNGICLNALHDKAFDRGLITITPDYRIKVSATIFDLEREKSIKRDFIKYQDKKIILPKKFFPEQEFLEFHNQNVFKG
jgi:putative restriction endonuclease